MPATSLTSPNRESYHEAALLIVKEHTYYFATNQHLLPSWGWSTNALYSVCYNLAFEVLLGTTFIDEHILATLLKDRKVNVRDTNPVAITEQ